MAVNYLTLRSTISYATDGSQAPINSLMAVSSIGVTTWTNRIAISTLTASSMTASTVAFSTMTASTIITVGSTITLAQNASVPNRYVQIGTDAVDTVYFDFHSKDSTLSDYSTRIISLGGATTGTGNLNMYASTIGLMGAAGVGIGTTLPSASLHIKNAASAMRITGNLTNTSTRPAVSTTPGAFEIRGSGAFDASDDGFLRLSAGGGSSAYTQSYIDISGYSTVADMGSNIVFGTGVERMRITSTGFVGIGTTNPYKPFHLTSSSTGDISALISNTNTTLASSASLGFGLWPASGSGSGSSGFAGQISAICMNAVNGNTDMAFSVYTGSSISPNYTLVERMRITAAGNVGIGTTSPTSVLTINNTGAYQTHHLIIRGQEFYQSGITGTGIAINAGVSRSANKQLWIMDPDLAVNTTNACVRISLGTGTGYIGAVSTEGNVLLPFGIGGSTVSVSTLGTGTVYSNGGVLTNTNPSDESLKTNIEPLHVSVDLLNPVQYNWIDTEKHGSSLQFGFLANEIQNIFPNIVSTWIDKDGSEKLGYDTVSLIPVLTSAIKQQNAKIATQAGTIDSLQTQIAVLEARLTAAGL